MIRFTKNRSRFCLLVAVISGRGHGGCHLNCHKNPAGLIIGAGENVYGEKSGSSKVEGSAKQTAKEEIADVLKKRFQEQGWIN